MVTGFHKIPCVSGAYRLPTGARCPSGGTSRPSAAARGTPPPCRPRRAARTVEHGREGHEGDVEEPAEPVTAEERPVSQYVLHAAEVGQQLRRGRRRLLLVASRLVKNRVRAGYTCHHACKTYVPLLHVR
jgi:hypothetical protein